MISYLWNWFLTYCVPPSMFRRWPLNRFYELKSDKEETLIEMDLAKDWVQDRHGLLWKGTDSVQ